MNKSVIHSDPEILGGTPVFLGTRVPIESLFDHLEGGVSLDEFLEDFPTVEREQAVELIRIKPFLSPTATNNIALGVMSEAIGTLGHRNNGSRR